MQKRPGHLGDIFIHHGLITPEDVERALRHQREWGGYFGDALVQLGLLSQEQVKWGLADQFDLPYVHIRPEHIDRSVAVQVPIEWARRHLMLPVLRDGNAVTVVLADPARIDRLDEVRRFTGADRVDAALSTSATLLQLIDSLTHPQEGIALSLQDWVRQVICSGATRLGISVRNGRACGWLRADIGGKRALQDDWREQLERIVSPFPSSTGSTVSSWPATLVSGGSAWRVHCHLAGGGSNLEWVAELITPLPHPQLDPAAFSAVTEALKQGDLAILASAGEGVGEELLESLLPRLPAAIRNPQPRSLHLADQSVPVPPEVLTIHLDEPIARTLDSLDAFAPEALTLDVARLSDTELFAARRVAPLVAFRTRSKSHPSPAADLPLRLCVRGETLVWILTSTADATD